MADMTAALDRLAASLAKESADIRDDRLTQLDGLPAESQAVRSALAAKVAELDGAVQRVESLADDLDANDAPVQPADPEPVDPTDPEQPANPDQPVEPQPDQPVDPDQPVQ